MSALILGATGLCGSGFLKAAEKADAFSKIFTLTRRPLPESDTVASQIVETDNSKWTGLIPDDTKFIFTALATTRLSLIHI